MEHGQLIKHDKPENIFKDKNWLEKHYLMEPTPSRFASELANYNWFIIQFILQYRTSNMF